MAKSKQAAVKAARKRSKSRPKAQAAKPQMKRAKKATPPPDDPLRRQLEFETQTLSGEDEAEMARRRLAALEQLKEMPPSDSP